MQARQRRNQKTPTLDYEHVSGGYYGDCPLPLDECPSAETGLEAENNYIDYLDYSKYPHYLGQFLNILFTLPTNGLKCPNNVGLGIQLKFNPGSCFGAMYMQNSTANPAHLPQKWAKWAKLAVQLVAPKWHAGF